MNRFDELNDGAIFKANPSPILVEGKTNFSHLIHYKTGCIRGEKNYQVRRLPPHIKK